MIKPNKRELAKIGLWLVEGETGLSSKAMASFYLTAGNGGPCASPLHAPTDPADLRRCVIFLKTCIDATHRMNLLAGLAQATDGWKKVFNNWMKLMQLYAEESKQKKAPRLYNFMRKLDL